MTHHFSIIKPARGIGFVYRKSNFPNVAKLTLLQAFELDVEIRQMLVDAPFCAINSISESYPGCEAAQCEPLCPAVSECRNVHYARGWDGRQFGRERELSLSKLIVMRLKEKI